MSKNFFLRNLLDLGLRNYWTDTSTNTTDTHRTCFTGIGNPNASISMLPLPPGSFIDCEELIQHVGEFAISQGYVVTIKQSKKDKVVVLGCDRGGVYRNRRKPADETSSGHSRKRKMQSRLTNCPFELVGKKEDGLWVLTVKSGSHNHEALKDISEHPSAQRFSENEVMLIKEMTDSGLKPRQLLKRLRQTNPDLLSTPKHVYNIKAQLRHGNLNVRRFKTLRPCISLEGSSQPAMTAESSWRRHYPPRNPNLIGGRFVDSQSSTSVDVINPATQQVVSQVPLSTCEEFKPAVFAAKRAFPLWRHTPVATRHLIMFKLHELIQRDIVLDKLAFAIATEQGKTLKDACSEVQRGLEIVECACGGALLQTGEFVSNMSNEIDTFSIREPVGVCAGICTFTFPAMIPLWIFPAAISCGNTFILKPSEKAPGACMILAELVMEAGLPNGVVNIVHGTNLSSTFDDLTITICSLTSLIDIVNAICDDDDIEVLSFVGTDAVSLTLGEDKLTERAKVLKVNAGTEPGADLGPVISQQVHTLTLISTPIGNLQLVVEYLEFVLQNYHVFIAFRRVKERISKLIQAIVDSGAKLVLDGRQIAELFDGDNLPPSHKKRDPGCNSSSEDITNRTDCNRKSDRVMFSISTCTKASFFSLKHLWMTKEVSKYELGNFIGPTILSDIKENIECSKEELLGPVLLCMQANSIDEAINFVNQNKKYCYGTSIFTGSRALARKFQIEIETRQVGHPFFTFIL
ncbi:methylmalonate-semialdehyde dehydrogenase [acylating], mitochondrial-like [Solanum dulcamara]|uniref:methylmalonate-semialdehyde dehydrogenase [acylating], mitochondrial-like n=1 Tax=Solanum dulcamara TaxID=45834 RepID=UPI002484FF42|nr:methylmalonate-semialdehyde dehydrogenase [acylating], mitochondrial-like [Solanum dulcamara]